MNVLLSQALESLLPFRRQETAKSRLQRYSSRVDPTTEHMTRDGWQPNMSVCTGFCQRQIDHGRYHAKVGSEAERRFAVAHFVTSILVFLDNHTIGRHANDILALVSFFISGSWAVV